MFRERREHGFQNMEPTIAQETAADMMEENAISSFMLSQTINAEIEKLVITVEKTGVSPKGEPNLDITFEGFKSGKRKFTK